MKLKVMLYARTEDISFGHWHWDSGVYGEERTDL